MSWRVDTFGMEFPVSMLPDAGRDNYTMRSYVLALNLGFRKCGEDGCQSHGEPSTPPTLYVMANTTSGVAVGGNRCAVV